jgi:hypothetical protein
MQRGTRSKRAQNRSISSIPMRASCLIDIENAVIVDVEATPARTYDEVAATKSMIERTDKRFGLKPKHLVVFA